MACGAGPPFFCLAVVGWATLPSANDDYLAGKYWEVVESTRQPNAPLCEPTPGLDGFRNDGEVLRFVFDEHLLDGVEEVAGPTWNDLRVDRPFKAIVAHHNPNFWLCWRQLLFLEPRRSLYQQSVFVSYAGESATPGNDHDCDQLVLLMDLVQHATAMPIGIAADVGASDGRCGFLWLNRGHVVHFFETGYAHLEEKNDVAMTLKANGWESRAFFHGRAGEKDQHHGDVEEQMIRLDSVLDAHEEVNVIKIDVDDLEDIWRTLLGMSRLFKKTHVVQIEMLEEEIGWKGFSDVFGLLAAANFAPFSIVEDLTELTARAQVLRRGLPYLRTCSRAYLEELVETMWPRAAWPDMPWTPMTSHGCWDAGKPHCWGRSPLGQLPYEFGMDRVQAIRLIPACRSQLEFMMRCHEQYVFVRRDSPLMPIVAARFGVCPDSGRNHFSSMLREL